MKKLNIRIIFVLLFMIIIGSASLFYLYDSNILPVIKDKNSIKAEGEDYYTLSIRGESSLVIGHDLVLREITPDGEKKLLENALNAAYLEDGRVLACDQSMALLELKDEKWQELLPICSVNGPFFQIPNTSKIVFMKPYGCKEAGDYASFNSIAIIDLQTMEEKEILKRENEPISLIGIFKEKIVVSCFKQDKEEETLLLLDLYGNIKLFEKLKSIPLGSRWPKMHFEKPYLSYPLEAKNNEKKVIIIDLEKEKKVFIDGEKPKWRKDGLEIIKSGKKLKLTIKEIENLIEKGSE